MGSQGFSYTGIWREGQLLVRFPHTKKSEKAVLKEGLIRFPDYTRIRREREKIVLKEGQLLIRFPDTRESEELNNVVSS